MPSTPELANLLAHLEPFVGETGGETAAAEIQSIVLDYRDRAGDAIETPTRPADVRHELEAIARAATALCEALADAEPESRGRLLAAGYFEAHDPRLARQAIERVQKVDAPEMVSKIETLANDARRAAEGLPADRGGKATLEARRQGPPKLWLAFACLALFDRCRPDQASATEQGAFHLFGEDVLAYAERKHAAGESMAPFVKRAVAWLRHWERQREASAAQRLVLGVTSTATDALHFARVTLSYEYLLGEVRAGSMKPSKTRQPIPATK